MQLPPSGRANHPRPAFCRPVCIMSQDAPADDSACLPVRRASSPPLPLSLPKLPIFGQRSSSPFAQPSSSLSPRADLPASASASATAAAAGPSLLPEVPAPLYTELLVLVHGLKGTTEDFTFFEQQLACSSPALEGRLLVYSSDVNTERTHDGIVEGGTRLGEDIQRIATLHPSLEKISLVGFSLGGVYARYVSALLFDAETGTLAGLRPQTFVTVASPNLGVRRFGIYRFLPQQLIGATKFLLGKTVDELVMNDAHGSDGLEPLMVRMSKDEGDGGLQFLSALRVFSKRVMYGAFSGYLFHCASHARLLLSSVSLCCERETEAD